jgi:hypothetical protein
MVSAPRGVGTLPLTLIDAQRCGGGGARRLAVPDIAIAGQRLDPAAQRKPPR